MPDVAGPPGRALASSGLTGLEQRVLARWRAVLPRPGTIIVGFSGGADSLALAAVLARLARRDALRPVLVHVDHRWREESAAEQAAAAALAEALATPLIGRRLDVHPAERHPGLGAEEAARRERYLALAAVAAEQRTDVIALAHHAQDQAETVLLHLIRGAGSDGLGGMRILRSLPLPYWSAAPTTVVRLWRPLLPESRRTVRAYAGRLQLSPVVDPSNATLDARRNRLRAEVLPILHAIAPGAVAAISRGATLAAEDSDYLTELAQHLLPSAQTATSELLAASVLAQPVPLRRRLVRLWLAQGAPALSVTAERTDAMLACLASAASGRTLEIGEGVTVRRTRRGLAWELPSSSAAG